jgi:hypothetical protein
VWVERSANLFIPSLILMVNRSIALAYRVFESAPVSNGELSGCVENKPLFFKSARGNTGSPLRGTTSNELREWDGIAGPVPNGGRKSRRQACAGMAGFDIERASKLPDALPHTT